MNSALVAGKEFDSFRQGRTHLEYGQAMVNVQQALQRAEYFARLLGGATHRGRRPVITTDFCCYCVQSQILPLG